MSVSIALAKVVVPLPIYQSFYYAIPSGYHNAVKPGMRVRVPFKNRRLIGIVVEVTSEEPDRCPQGLKGIIEIIDSEPFLSDTLLQLTRWLAGYYFAPWGEVMKYVLPPGEEKSRMRVSPVSQLLERNRVAWKEKKLNADQEKVVFELISALGSNVYQCFLLHGVTGSGKTEVYIRVIAQALELGKTAIVLVPEISLTPQVLERFWECFGAQIALLHSHLSPGERWQEWRRLRSGEAKIAIGVRSAVFAPLEKLGVIIVDEEHDASYKQNETPRYNARDVAIYRGRIQNSLIILGSATPSLESFYNTRSGKYKYLQLPYRIDHKPLPSVEIVDMRFRRSNTRDQVKKSRLTFSSRLLEAIDQRLALREQILIFLNRRGFSTYIQCEECGFVHQCPNCSVAMTFHKREANCCCHYCGYNEKPYDICPNCSGHIIKYSGFGTQKIEEELKKYFPEARIERMDRDTTRKKLSHHSILSRLSTGEIDILVGTQMITKGLDFPLITLVGVVAGDLSLNFPDFRASEKTFQLLTQVAGRAGRGDKSGEVIIQTLLPKHYGFLYAKEHNYLAFFNQELSLRHRVFFPPFARIALIRTEGVDSNETFEAAKQIGNLLRTEDSLKKKVTVLGPARAPLAKIKNLYRFHLLLKAPRAAVIQSFLNELRPSIDSIVLSRSRLKVTFDIDPVSLL